MDTAADLQRMLYEMPRLQPPPRCGTLTHDNHDVALLSHPQASDSEITRLNWSGGVTWTPGGTAIIRGEKGDLEPNKGDDE